MKTLLIGKRAKLVRGDAFEVLALPEAEVAGIVTDPPFGFREFDVDLERVDGISGGVWRHPQELDGIRRRPVPRFTVVTPDELEEIEAKFDELGRLFLRLLRPGGHVVLATHPLTAPYVTRALVRSLELRGTFIRLVRTLRGGDRPKGAEAEFPDIVSMAHSAYEPWVVLRRPLSGTLAENLRTHGVGGLRRGDPPLSDVIESGRTPKREREIVEHPALKPQAFLRRLVAAVLPMGRGTVLDPFAGSGSTLAAAEALDLPSIGIERNPEYFRTALEAVPRLSKV